MKLSVICALLVGLITCDVTSADSWEDGSQDGVGPTGRSCVCGNRWNPCSGNVGNKIVGCPSTNGYISCTNTNCALVTCPTGQVWNQTTSKCQTCPQGMHVTSDNQRCACNLNTTLNSTTRTCVRCPNSATVLPDRCYCAKPLALNRLTNTCQACPGTSRLDDDQCKCTSSSTFFNRVAWACQQCPAQLVLPVGGKGRPRCRCTGQNEIFYLPTFSCYKCPAGTIPDQDGDECSCSVSGQRFDMSSQACQCRPGLTLQGGFCLPASSTTTTGPTFPSFP